MNQAAPTIATHLAMIAWFPVCMALFLALRPVRAVCVGVVAGVLLLPNVSYDLIGLPAYDKTMAIGAGLMVSALLFDLPRVLALRPSWIDLPMVVLCASPFVTALLNGFTAYDGLADSFQFVVRWGLPWTLGRLYVADFEAQHFLGVAIVAGALLYVPLCLWEIKMSPDLHTVVYGIKLKAFKHANRGAIWRPNVFMFHGLMLALFMGSAALLAFWFHVSRARTRVLGMPMAAAAAILALTTVSASSANALLMMLCGMACLWCSQRFRWSLPLLLLVSVAPLYIGLRYGAGWRATELTEVAEAVLGRERAESLGIRIDNEIYLSQRAKERPWFGYRDILKYTGNRPDEGVHRATIDSIWILYLGATGFVSVAALFAFLLLPAICVWRAIPPALWSHAAFASTVTLALMATLLALDFLLNAHENPVFTLGAAGVAGLLATKEGRAAWARA
jgi:hypothetical protein